MRYLKKISFIAASFFILAISASRAWAESVRKEYGVSGMVCSFCSQGIEKKFKKQNAVQDVEVSLKDKKLVLTFKENQNLTDQEVSDILESAGYKMTEKGK